MADNSAPNETPDQPDVDPSAATRQLEPAASDLFARDNCICMQRLADAIADVPPRRHELEVLRMYGSRDFK